MAKKKEPQPKIVVTVDENDQIEVQLTKPEYFNARHMGRVSRQINRERKIQIKKMLRDVRAKEITNG